MRLKTQDSASGGSGESSPARGRRGAQWAPPSQAADAAGGAADRAADAVRGSHFASAVARAGFVARGGFYLVLSYLAARIAALPGRSTPQANAQGALSLASRSTLGAVAVLMAAAGFLMLGVLRLLAAWRDRETGFRHRLPTAAQGLLYVAVAWIPVSYVVFGNHRAGSEQQQQKTTGDLLGLPGGRLLVVALGLTVLGACAWQVRGAAVSDYAAGLDLSDLGPRARRVVNVIARVGIAARAFVFLPLAIFFFVAAARANASAAKGLDAQMLELSGHPGGRAVLVLVAAGLAVFAAYSFLEARFRVVQSAA